MRRHRQDLPGAGRDGLVSPSVPWLRAGFLPAVCPQPGLVYKQAVSRCGLGRWQLWASEPTLCPTLSSSEARNADPPTIGGNKP